MRFDVVLTEDAVRDLERIYDYIAARDLPKKADAALARIEETIGSLVTMPARGAFPPELLALGMREYREVFFKPYRIIYRIIDRKVVVYLVTDGRRDMQTLLAERLLAG